MTTQATKPTLAELQDEERLAHEKWREAVRKLDSIRGIVKQLSEAHARAQRAVIAELQRQVKEGDK